ncbi:MAG: small metal-binding protein SmbP [Methylocystis sp.]
MKRREFVGGMAALGLVQVAGLPTAFAAGDHVAQAITQINKAIPYGEEPHHSSSFVQHIDNAIDHAVMADRAHPNSAIKTAIFYLRRARGIAYGTHLLRYSRRGAALAQKAMAKLQTVQ